MIPSKTDNINHQDLLRFSTGVLQAIGVDAQDAALVADSLVEADLRGTDTHGVARLPHYVDRIRHGSINIKPVLKTTRLAPALARLDSDHCLGQIANAKAAEVAIDLAGEAGAGWVSIANASHCGAMSYFGNMIARADMVGFAFTHVDPMVVPHGAREPFCGTNPLCITAPGLNGDILCLDMATSVTPWNAVANAEIEGHAIPAEWAVDEAGQSTTDPAAVVGLKPTGDYKGSGLGLMIDMLCALLSNSPYGPDISRMYGDMSEKRRLGGLIGAIDIKQLVPVEQFQKRASEMIRRWGALQPSEPGGRVLYPGEKEEIIKKDRIATGIPMGKGVLQTLDQLAASVGVPPLNAAPNRMVGEPPDIIIRAQRLASGKQVENGR